jgi:hypothetical protein
LNTLNRQIILIAPQLLGEYSLDLLYLHDVTLTAAFYNFTEQSNKTGIKMFSVLKILLAHKDSRMSNEKRTDG